MFNNTIDKINRMSSRLWKPPVHSIDELLNAYSAKKEDVFFVQIGSHDGVAGDPIHQLVVRDNWAGILIEPVERIFNLLRDTYKEQENLIFENIAISDSPGEKDFFQIEFVEGITPGWIHGSGSLDHGVVESAKKLAPAIEDLIYTQKVECLTYDGLLKKHRVKRVDVLHMDTEGHDYEIIKSIDLGKQKPDIIIFEHRHLSNSDYKKCLALLKRNGYRLCRDGHDTMARLK